MLAMRALLLRSAPATELLRRRLTRVLPIDAAFGCAVATALGFETAQPQNECGSLPWLRPRPHLAFVRLHDLVNDGQAQPCAALEVRLERLEDFFDLLRRHARSGVGER